MKDALGDRMKGHYEVRTQTLLPRRSYAVLRVDGKAFHTYTRGCERPFDVGLMQDMDSTAMALMKEVQGSRLAYVQSDEISVLFTDFDTPQTEMWFDGNVQKITSIAASAATAAFNAERTRRAIRDYYGDWGEALIPHVFDLIQQVRFDARVFILPDSAEVENYFIWRQQDATRNSVSMAAHTYFSHNELQRVDTAGQQELLFSKGVNWNDYPAGFKRGRCVIKVVETSDLTYTDKRTGEQKVQENVERRVLKVVDPPIFTQEREWLRAQIPQRAS